MKETFRCEWVRCGKATCRSCPHGPYWYAYWKEGGKTRKRYVGKGDPRGEPARGEPAPDAPRPPNPLDDIFDARKANLPLAWRIMGMPPTRHAGQVAERYRRLMREHHPDRGGDETTAKRIVAAYAYIRRTVFNGK